ncbi:MAG TPA: site-2 protease family protein [Armatimonadota bacterium]|jgi:hypothetical protein
METTVEATEPSRATPGWRLVGERSLTEEEAGALRALMRRYYIQGILAGAGLLALLVLWGWSLSEAMPRSGRSAEPAYLALIFGPMILAGIGIAAISDAARRSGGLKRDLKRGCVIQCAGSLQWSVYYEPAVWHLLKCGLLRRTPGEVQTLEILPNARLVWRVNGSAPPRSHFESAPIVLPPAEPPAGASPARPDRVRRRFETVGWISAVAAAEVCSVTLPGPGPVRVALGALLGAVTILATIGVHEGGHLVTGRLLGMRILDCQVGPVSLTRTASGPRLGWRGLDLFLNGYALLTDGDERGYRWRHALMVACGPLASLALAVALVVVGWHPALTALAPTPYTEAIRVFAFVAAAYVAFGASSTRIPETGQVTDLALLGWLWRDPEGARHAARQSVLSARLIRGDRPRDLDAGLLARASRDPWGGASAWAHLMWFYHHLDAGRLEQARASLDTALSSQNTGYPRLEMAFYQGLYERNAAAARAHLDAAVPQRGGSDARRAEAAVLLAEGGLPAARAAAEAAIARLKTETGAGLAAAKEEWLRRIIDECTEKPRNPAGESEAPHDRG